MAVPIGLVANPTEKPLGLFPGKRSGGMSTGSLPRWQRIVVALLALCVIGYIWALQ
jgi:hypothetical protein